MNLRYLWCRLAHREGALCVTCWLRTEEASRARHPAGRWWFR